MADSKPSRRGKENRVNYNYQKFGSAGIFASEGMQPIEYLLTSVPIKLIDELSFARDVQSDKRDFDYLIQRDIDEERARKEICTYLAAGEKGKVAFLPPLIAAIVEVDSDGRIEDYYPDCEVSYDGKVDLEEVTIENDKELVREWPGLYKITSYVDKKAGVKLPSDTVSSKFPIDIQQVNFEMYRSVSSAGGRLVVIDGQHRLFALRYLIENEPDKVSGLTVPICIVHSPLSTKINSAQDSNTLSVSSVLRRLFVDVNSTVEKVSGHFLTLLSDDNIGSMICREFCSKVHGEEALNERGLGLVEWNTKNHKESKTISRKHSITSIGVIYDTLESLFYSKSGAKNLRTLLDFDLGSYELEDHEAITDYLPWTGFDMSVKNSLKEKVKKSLVDTLYSLFFEPKVYKESVAIFNEILDEKLESIKSERDIYSECIPYLKKYYLYNDPIPSVKSIDNTLNARCKKILKEINLWHDEQISKRSNQTAFLAVYQKSVIAGWVELFIQCKKYGLSESLVASIYVRLIDATFEKERSLFDYHQPYMQDNVYIGPRIRATKRTINQFKMLTLSYLGNDVVLLEICEKLSLSKEVKSKLETIGKENASRFFKGLTQEKEKLFEKNYKHNFSLSNEQKRELSEAENRRNSDIYSSDDSGNKVEAVLEFEQLIKRMVTNDLKECANILSVKFEYSDFFYLVDDYCVEE
ncbi:TPA: hypothetical protein ACX6QT_002246 [Photobacterium damselae]